MTQGWTYRRTPDPLMGLWMLMILIYCSTGAPYKIWHPHKNFTKIRRSPPF